MPNALEKIFIAMVEIEMRIEGVEAAFVYRPESMSVFPCFENYAVRGSDIRIESSTIQGFYTLGAALHVTRGIVNISEEQCRPFPIRVSDAFWNDPTLQGTVTTVLAVRHLFAPLIYGGEIHAGIRFEIDVKVRRAVDI